MTDTTKLPARFKSSHVKTSTWQSVGIHLLFALVLALLFFWKDSPPVLMPIELVELVNKSMNTEPNRPKSQPVAPVPSLSKTPAVPTSATVGPPSTDQTPVSGASGSTGGGDTGPVSEDYEVGELPVLLNEIKIPYPPAAKAKNIQGPVVFELVIGKDGRVADAKLVSAPAPDLAEAARIALREFRFKPAKLNQAPVAVRIRYTYRFIIQ